MVDLIIPARASGYNRGKDAYEQIIRGAYDLLVDEGVDALTMRNIAARCNLQAGNLRYYFASKSDLIRDLLSAITYSYTAEIERIAVDSATSAEQRMRNVIDTICDDITSVETTRVFTSLWAGANYDEFVLACIQDIYRPATHLLKGIVISINPDISDSQAADIAVYIQASLEGLTVFAGHGREYAPRMQSFEKIAADAIISYIKCVTKCTSK